MDALLSSGCNDDARLAFHAEGARNAEFVLRYAPRAGRRAAALGARREAAAQYERALRFVPSHSRHRSPRMAHMPPNCGIGWRAPRLGRILKVSPGASRKFSSFSRKANPMKRLQAACSFR